MQKLLALSWTVVLAAAVIVVAACGSSRSTSPTSSPRAVAGASSPAASAGTERPAPPETNPAGDIPDTQVFVPFHSQEGGYTLEAPEGWARTTTGADVRFTDKLDGEAVSLKQAPAAPTSATARAGLVPALTAGGRAVQVTSVSDVKLPGGPAVLVAYTANSEPDAVTGKQVRLEEHAYYFFSGGKLATLTLWAPVGADNVDQWQRVAQSFRWS